MKIESNVYVLAQDSDDEVLYLCEGAEGYFFDSDIRFALKAKSKITTLYIKDDFRDETKIKADLRTVPLKITYEW